MPSLDLQQFGGLAPKIAKRKLPDGSAQTAQSVRLDSGDLESLYGTSSKGQPDLADTPKTIFPYGNFWFSWPDEVNAINSPVAQDQYDRVYYTGDGKPKVTSNLIATGGSGPYPTASYDLGVPVPAAAPTNLTVNGTDSDPENFSDDDTRFYLITYVTEYGEEGAPGPVSSAITVDEPSTQTVSLDLPVPAVNTANITKKRLYRTATSGDDTAFFFVAEYLVSAVTVTDSTLPTGLGAALETDDFLPPPTNMQGLVLGPNGIAAGFVENEILFSEPFLPYAWPNAYKRSLEYPIVSIQTFGSSFLVTTTGTPFIFSGVSPDSMSERKLEISQSCVSSRSTVDMGNFVIYASPDGLVGVNSDGAKLLTEKIFDNRSWADFDPETIHASQYEQYYVGFYGDTNGNGSGTGSFLYDPNNGQFTTDTTYGCAAYHDLVADRLNYSISDVGGAFLYDFNQGLTQRPFTYKSKVYRVQDSSFTCAKIHTDNAANIRFKVWVNGELITDANPITTEVIRLAPRRGTDWEFEVSGTGAVSRVTLATSMGEL